MAGIFEEIRAAIQASEKSRYAIARETGVSESQLCHFMQGTKGLSVESLERLADYLGYEIVIRPQKRAKKLRKKGR